MGASTDTNNELTSGTVQTISMNGYIRELNEEMSNGAIYLNDSVLFPSNSTSVFSFTSLNSYPQSPISAPIPDTGGGEIK